MDRVHFLRVSRSGAMVLEATVTEAYAKGIVLLAWSGASHCAEFPEHAPMVLGRLYLTIEASLQATPAAHADFLRLSELAWRDGVPLVVDVVRRSTSTTSNGLDGGGGEDGGWLTSGGGGGGGGIVGGAGGRGSPGFMAIFQLDADGCLLDVDVLTAPGTSTWQPRRGTTHAKVVGAGGSGGGGGGASLGCQWAHAPGAAPTKPTGPHCTASVANAS
jgi:hypothetical protein